MTILGLLILVLGVAMLAFSIQIFMHDKDDFEHNHEITGDVSNAVSGDLNVNKSKVPEEISLGFNRDIRTNKLVPCSQVSKEGIRG